MSRATRRNPDSELRRNPSENARDVEWIEIESSHQQGSSLGVGEARLLRAALGVPRHRQVSLTQTRAPRAMHVCSARTQPLAGNRHATLQNPEAPSCAGTQLLAGNFATRIVCGRTRSRQIRELLIRLFVAAAEDELSFWFAMISSHDHHYHQRHDHDHHHDNDSSSSFLSS